MMLGDIVAKVFDTRMPEDANVLVGYLVHDPKITHFHGSGALAFYGVIGDANCGGVVAVDRGRRLGMAHFLENQSDDFCFLDV
jgi:hypothetical protein